MTAHLRRINPPQLAFAVIGYPHRTKAVADSVGLGIIAILVNHFVARRINARHRISVHRHPDKAAAITDFTALARDMHWDNGHDLVASRIDTRNAAVRLAQHP